jgi:hypothetical protein
MHEGYSLHLPAGQCTKFVAPDGTEIPLAVEGDVPYVCNDLSVAVGAPALPAAGSADDAGDADAPDEDVPPPADPAGVDADVAVVPADAAEEAPSKVAQLKAPSRFLTCWGTGLKSYSRQDA